jgi:hypothetical protein
MEVRTKPELFWCLGVAGVYKKVVAKKPNWVSVSAKCAIGARCFCPCDSLWFLKGPRAFFLDGVGSLEWYTVAIDTSTDSQARVSKVHEIVPTAIGY